MTIHFQCLKCQKAFAVKDEYAGKAGKCTCGAGITVPKPMVTVAPVRPPVEDMIRFACKMCGRRIKVPMNRAGQQGKCPQCKNIISIPTTGDDGAIKQAITPILTLQPRPSTGVIRIPCVMCGMISEVPESSAGNLVECKKCGSFIDVPLPKGAVAAATRIDDRVLESVPKKASPCTGRTVCPSCNKKLDDDTTVCVGCGIYISSGRPILSTRGIDEDDLYDRAHTVISPLSWIIPFGIYPVYSEVMGKCRPYATWAITAVTILISAWFLAYEYSDSPKMRSMKNLMLWAGKAQPDSERIEMFYEYTSYGDRNAFDAKRKTLKATVSEEELNLASLNALSLEEQCFGKFRFTQLITHAFLHGGPLHLAGNLLFLLIFGSRVCSVIGNIWTPILYLILAIGAGFTHLVMSGFEPPGPMLGASGAIMGMAGVYLVLFPIQKVYMAAWWRWGLLVGFRLSFNTFAVRGFWVVLFYICFDIVAVSLTADTGTAHWAHIGGFMWGIAGGLILLMTRAAYSGSDILSLIFGKYAWRLIGTPANRG